MATAQMVRLAPRGSWVLVQPRAVVSEVTKTGIIKVDQSGEKPQTGVVLAIGPKVETETPGNLVLYGKYVGVEVDLGDYEALLIQEQDIISGVELHDVELEDESAADEAEPLIAVAAR